MYRIVDKKNHLSYEGQSNFKYIPVDEDVELNLGHVSNVLVEPVLMDYRTDDYMFNKDGNITGWKEIREFKIKVKNTRDLQVKVEIQRNFDTSHWSLKKKGEFGKYEKIDLDTVKFTLNLPKRAQKEFRYIVTTRHGTRE